MADRAPALPGGPPTASAREFVATFVLLLGLIVALLAFDLSLARVERDDNTSHASNLYREGRAQLDSGHVDLAVDRLSTAVSLERSNIVYALALAQAIMRQGRTDDAEQMVASLLERAQNDGAVNLTMARILAPSRRTRDAAAFYHRAIYGRWGDDSVTQRVRARMELIRLLDAGGTRAELLSELLSLQSDPADSTALLAQVAPLYLRAGSPSRAAEAYHALLRRAPRDVAARRRLQLVDTVLALDPTARGLGDAVRLARSRALLARTIATVDGCIGTTVPPSPVRDSAVATLVGVARGVDLAEASESALAAASALWRTRPPACAPDTPSSENALVLLHRSLGG